MTYKLINLSKNIRLSIVMSQSTIHGLLVLTMFNMPLEYKLRVAYLMKLLPIGIRFLELYDTSFQKPLMLMLRNKLKELSKEPEHAY